jgi:hypothetical protein
VCGVVVDSLLCCTEGYRCRQRFSAAGVPCIAGMGAAGDLEPDLVAGTELVGGRPQVDAYLLRLGASRRQPDQPVGDVHRPKEQLLCSVCFRWHELASNGILIVRARPSAGCRATGNHAAPEDAAWPAQARARNVPAAAAAPRKPSAHETPGSQWHQDRRASQDHGGQPGGPGPFGAAGQAGPAPASSRGTVVGVPAAFARGRHRGGQRAVRLQVPPLDTGRGWPLWQVAPSAAVHPLDPDGGPGRCRAAEQVRAEPFEGVMEGVAEQVLA